MKNKILIEVNCPHRNNVGACEVSVLSNHCLNCPLGLEWHEKHIKILKEDTKLWGKEVKRNEPM